MLANTSQESKTARMVFNLHVKSIDSLQSQWLVKALVDVCRIAPWICFAFSARQATPVAVPASWEAQVIPLTPMASPTRCPCLLP